MASIHPVNRDFWLLWTASGLSNLGDGIRLTALPLLRQTLTPDRLLGRVVASFRLIGFGALPAGAIFGGWIARVAGLRSPYLVTAILLTLVALVVYRVSTEEGIAS